MAAGGQGAPIVPVFHRALVAAAGFKGPVALLNIGGVANVTYIEEGLEPIACDTGPGNALIDDLMLQRTGAPIDRHGQTAARVASMTPRCCDCYLIHFLRNRRLNR